MEGIAYKHFLRTFSMKISAASVVCEGGTPNAMQDFSDSVSFLSVQYNEVGWGQLLSVLICNRSTQQLRNLFSSLSLRYLTGVFDSQKYLT